MALLRAHELGCSTVQIFSHNPRAWHKKEISDNERTLFCRLREKFGISPVYVHASYLINIASSSEELRRKSIALLGMEMEMAGRLGAEFVVLHTGSATDRYGIHRSVGSLKEVLEEGRYAAGLLVENTSGKRGDIASAVQDLARIMDGTGGLVSGVCIDTCHAFAAGYDLGTDKGLRMLSGQIRKHIGSRKLKLIHLNDSKGQCGSGTDRHEHIGEGRIGTEALRRFLVHKTFRDIPVVLETPRKTDADDMENLRRVKKMLEFG